MTDRAYSLRPLAESDLSEWLRLRSGLWDEPSDADHKAEMFAILEDPDSQFVVVCEVAGGRLGGFLEAGIRPFVEDCETDQVGYIEGWFVEPHLRGRGIGGRLVQAAEEWARSMGCTEMASDTEVENELSVDIHLKLGYDITSQLVHFKKDLE
jgi:aminoglycoside 6'-N-acetyltransferase I